MEFKKLQKKVCYYWIIKRFIFLVILAIGYVLGIHYVTTEFKLLVIVPGALFLLISLINTFIFPFLQIKVYQYFIDDEKIIISYGVLFRVPIVQIQDISSFQGPIQIGFKISSIIISTARSNVVIKSIDHLLAREIVEDIQKKIHKRLMKENKDEALS